MESEGLTPYELRVKKNIEENQRVLRSLGLLNPVFEHEVNGKKNAGKSNVPVKNKSTPKPKLQSNEATETPYIPAARRTRRSSSILKSQGYDEFDEIPVALDDEGNPPTPKKRKVVEPVFGPVEGVSVGDVWLTRIECSSAGVHRPTVAGIHGKLGEGCYSLALSGGYEDDVDYGDCFTYTGSGGRDLTGTKTNPKNLRTAPQTKDQVLEGPNAALASNVESKKPVRVVRGYKLQSPYAPEEGYRYDGLYSVERYWTATGLSGFKVCKFALKRLPDQDPPPWRTFPFVSPEKSLEHEPVVTNVSTQNGFSEHDETLHVSEANKVSKNEENGVTPMSTPKCFTRNVKSDSKGSGLEKSPTNNLKLSPKEGNLKLSPKEGNLKLSPKEGNLKLSPKEGNLKLSPKEGNLKLSPKEGNQELNSPTVLTSSDNAQDCIDIVAESGFKNVDHTHVEDISPNTRDKDLINLKIPHGGNNKNESNSIKVSNGQESCECIHNVISNLAVSHANDSHYTQSKVSPNLNMQLKCVETNSINTESKSPDTPGKIVSEDSGKRDSESNQNTEVTPTGNMRSKNLKLNCSPTIEVGQITEVTPNSIGKKVRFSPKVCCTNDECKNTMEQIMPSCNKKFLSTIIPTENCNTEKYYQCEPENVTKSTVVDSKKQASILKYFGPVKKSTETELLKKSVNPISLRSNRYSYFSGVNYNSSSNLNCPKNDTIPTKIYFESQDETTSSKDFTRKEMLSSKTSAESKHNKRKHLSPNERSEKALHMPKDSFVLEKNTKSIKFKCLKKAKIDSNTTSLVKTCYVNLCGMKNQINMSPIKSCYVDVYKLEDAFLGWDFGVDVNGEFKFLGFDEGDIILHDSQCNILKKPQNADYLFHGWDCEENDQPYVNPVFDEVFGPS